MTCCPFRIVARCCGNVDVASLGSCTTINQNLTQICLKCDLFICVNRIDDDVRIFMTITGITNIDITFTGGCCNASPRRGHLMTDIDIPLIDRQVDIVDCDQICIKEYGTTVNCLDIQIMVSRNNITHMDVTFGCSQVDIMTTMDTAVGIDDDVLVSIHRIITSRCGTHRHITFFCVDDAVNGHGTRTTFRYCKVNIVLGDDRITHIPNLAFFTDDNLSFGDLDRDTVAGYHIVTDCDVSFFRRHLDVAGFSNDIIINSDIAFAINPCSDIFTS